MKKSAHDSMGKQADWVRDTAKLPVEHWKDSVRGDVFFRTAFGDGSGNTDTFTAGVAELQPQGRLACHRHSPAEVYYIIEGHGAVTLGGVENPVSAGSAVFIPGGCEHEIRNEGSDVLKFFYVLAADSLDDVEYQFSRAGIRA